MMRPSRSLLSSIFLVAASLVAAGSAAADAPTSAPSGGSSKVLLRLDGQPQGLAKNVSTLQIDAAVIREGGYTVAPPGALRWPTLRIEQHVGGVSAGTAKWMNEQLAGPRRQHGFEAILLDESLQPLVTISAPSSFLGPIEMPKVTKAKSTSPLIVAFTLYPQSITHTSASSGVPQGASAAAVAAAAQGSGGFRLTIDGVDTSGVLEVEGWSPTSAAPAAVEGPSRPGGATTPAGGNATLTLSVALPGKAFADWAASAGSPKKSGKLEYLTTSEHPALTVSFTSLKVSKVAAATSPAQPAASQVVLTASGISFAAGGG